MVFLSRELVHIQGPKWDMKTISYVEKFVCQGTTAFSIMLHWWLRMENEIKRELTSPFPDYPFHPQELILATSLVIAILFWIKSWHQNSDVTSGHFFLEYISLSISISCILDITNIWGDWSSVFLSGHSGHLPALHIHTGCLCFPFQPTSYFLRSFFSLRKLIFHCKGWRSNGRLSNGQTAVISHTVNKRVCCMVLRVERTAGVGPQNVNQKDTKG